MTELSEGPASAAAFRLATTAGAGVADYVAILKPRVMSLVVFTGLVGLVVAPGHLHPVLAAVAVLCIAVGAGAAGAINMWYDRDIDALMRRTARRPLPAGRMLPGEALGFGAVLAVGAVLVMGLAINWVAAELLALTIGFYVFVYTIWLKRRTPQNIVIGGAAGAFPPIIGWAAVTGEIGWGAIALFAIIFFWTPPHFWALSLYRTGDYATAGVPMLPVVAGRRETKRQMLIYTLVLWPATAAPWLLGVAGGLYGGRAAAERGLHRLGGPGLARRRRAQRAADVRLFVALSVPDLQPAAGRPHRRRAGIDGHGSRARAAADDTRAQPRARRRARRLGGAVLRHHDRADGGLGVSEAARAQRRRRNGATVLLLGSVVAGMVGLSFASVPLYRLFCQATGLGGTTQRAAAAPAKAAAAVLTVRFDAETAPDLGWEFRPLQSSVTVHPGEQRQIFYRAVNKTSEPVTGTATYNVTPAKAGIYFDKLQCFCFSEQHLAAGESADMGVVFFVDPDILTDPNTRDVHTITLSYTMFRAHEPARPTAFRGTAGTVP